MYLLAAKGLFMITITSLQAQNKFGELIDTSQREPVVITRRGRPTSFVMSAAGDPEELRYEFTKLISALFPLRGKAAVDEIRRVTAPIGARSKALGLTEKALTKILNED